MPPRPVSPAPTHTGSHGAARPSFRPSRAGDAAIAQDEERLAVAKLDDETERLTGARAAEPAGADDQHDAVPELPGRVSFGARDHHGPEEGNFSEARASYGAVSGRVNSTLLSTHQTRST